MSQERACPRNCARHAYVLIPCDVRADLQLSLIVTPNPEFPQPRIHKECACMLRRVDDSTRWVAFLGSTWSERRIAKRWRRQRRNACYNNEVCRSMSNGALCSVMFGRLHTLGNDILLPFVPKDGSPKEANEETTN